MLLGHVVNSDAAIVARALAALGANVYQTRTVGDNPQRMESALREALERSDLVAVTGGLGPTGDDLTREVAARVCGARLRPDSEQTRRLREFFGDSEIGENQYSQALVPEGATVFENALGTAPGLAIPCRGGKIIILLPGPPRELEAMLEGGVVPYLEKLKGMPIISRLVRVFGMGEGEAAERLGELTDSANPTVATYASDGEMFVKITARAPSREEAAGMIAPYIEKTRERLGDVVYGVDVPSLESVVVTELTRGGQTVSAAESCTGGLLAKRITDQPGSSAVFRLGVVSYSNEAKINILGIEPELLRSFGAVSPQVALAMARGCRRLDGADYGVGITGIAGPDGGTPEKPLGLVFIALAFEGGSWIFKMSPRGRYLGRDWVRRRASSRALDMLRRKLYGLPFKTA